MRQERVDQGMLLMPGTRMHHQSSGFVQHQQVVVLENNLERHLFRQRFDFFERRFCEFDRVAGANRVAWTRILPVQLDESIPNQGLEPSAGKGGEPQREKAVQPQSRVLPLDFKFGHR
jgi:hypothetical protein